MRNILLALLLANILYFMYERFAESPTEFGVAVVDERDLGPELALEDNPMAEPAASVGAVIGEGTPSDLAAIVGRSCVTVGPFNAGSDADAALKEIEADGMRAAIRSREGEVFVGHWVQIRNIANRSVGNEMIAKLKEGGLDDAYLVETEDEGLKISLGLFGEIARAERIELQAKSMGLPADISPRMRDATVFYVDVGLPPGRGASTIVQEFGEDQVLMRDAANCPGQ
jgi:hypothetical protein